MTGRYGGSAAGLMAVQCVVVHGSELYRRLSLFQLLGCKSVWHKHIQIDCKSVIDIPSCDYHATLLLLKSEDLFSSAVADWS
ncbi:unnamed protein product [Ilex paraguariensis]|uniref:Uncharacterized protein n=1 Tax=Ilex paraguariensis TaxID=185542 RepID=A0ABC8UL50_9AQUA